MILGKLTALKVKNARTGRHSDGDGLILLVKPTGGSSWVLRVQVNGVRRDIGLGSVETDARCLEDDIPLAKKRILTLAEAREKSTWLRKMAKSGRDPILEQQRDRSPIPIFRDAAIAARAAKTPDWSPRTARAFDNTMRDYVYPAIGNIQVDQIDGQIIESILRPIWHRKPEAAQKVRQRLCMVLNFAQAKRWRTSGAPSEALAILLGDRPQGNNLPAMPFEDVPAFIVKLQNEPETIGRLALQFLILTGARSGEVRGATKHQIDLEKKLWNRPADIMKGKNAKAHSVTLNDVAIDILQRAEAHNGAADNFIFSGASGGMISDMTISKIMAESPYVPHGFRSSFRDWAAEKMPHIPDPVAEAALAHVVPDKVTRAYKRTDFIDMRRELLSKWGDFCISGSKL